MEKSLFHNQLTKTIAAVLLFFLFGFTPAGETKEKPRVVEFDYVEKILQSKEDKVYVLNFWATWCKPCVEELPEFEAARNNFTKQNVEFIYISLDFTSKLQDKVIPFAEKNLAGAEVVLLSSANQNEWIPKVSEEWSGAIPATLILNPAKGKKYFHEGQFTQQELEQIIKSQQ